MTNSELDSAKARIKRLYEQGCEVRVNVHTSRPKVCIEGARAVIKGVYPNIFRIEEREDGYPRCHTVQYTDLLTGQVEIWLPSERPE